jgi:type IV secretory pathway TraG/TraD family ATPase VirD4
MQWFFLLPAIMFITRYIYPLTQSLVRSAIIESELGIWNVGNWLSTAIATIISLLCAYGAVSFIEATSKVRGKAERIKFLQQASLWLVYISATVLATFLMYHILLNLAIKPFAFLSSAMTLFVIAWILSLVESPDFEFNPVIQGLRITKIRYRKYKQNMKLSIIWGRDLIDHDQENRHFLTLGNTRSGKSTFMLMNIGTVAALVSLKQDYRAIFYDPKNNLVPMLQKVGTPFFIMNPLDTRSVGWLMYKDIVNATQALEVAKMLLPEKEAQEDFWIKSAQGLITGVIKTLMHLYKKNGRPWDLRDVINATESEADLKVILNHLPENRGLLEKLKEGSNNRNDFLTTLQTYLLPFAAIASLEHATEAKISLRDFLSSESVLHLGSDNEMSSVLIGWYGLIVKVLTNYHLTMTESRTRRTFWFFDEATDGARFFGDTLIRLLTLGGGFGCCVFLYIQNKAAMDEKFGKQQAKQIAGLCFHKAIIGGVDFDTAQWFAKDVVGENLQIIATTTSVKKAPSEHFKESRSSVEKGGAYTPQSRLAIQPTKLMDQDFSKTSPETGMTGFFMGSRSGAHWHHYTWEEVQKRQVKVDDNTIRSEGYKRVPVDSPLHNLTPWTDEERVSLGLPTSDESVSLWEIKQQRNLDQEDD